MELLSSPFISENCTLLGSARSAVWRRVSPSELLMVMVLSSLPSASRPSALHAPHVTFLVCLPTMGIFLWHKHTACDHYDGMHKSFPSESRNYECQCFIHGQLCTRVTVSWQLLWNITCSELGLFKLHFHTSWVQERRQHSRGEGIQYLLFEFLVFRANTKKKKKSLMRTAKLEGYRCDQSQLQNDKQPLGALTTCRRWSCRSAAGRPAQWGCRVVDVHFDAETEWTTDYTSFLYLAVWWL